MMLKYTHGIDIIQLNRIELKNLDFAKRFMTNNEYVICKQITDFKQKQKYVASIWALKEAIIKATNHKYLFSIIEIKLSLTSAPTCNIPNINLSIAYENEYIVASAIYQKE